MNDAMRRRQRTLIRERRALMRAVNARSDARSADMLRIDAIDVELAMIRDVEAMDEIRNIMSGKVWDPETLNAIAREVEATGRSVEEPSDEAEAEARAFLETGRRPS